VSTTSDGMEQAWRAVRDVDSDSFRYRTVWLRALFADTGKSGEKPRLQIENNNHSRTTSPNKPDLTPTMKSEVGGVATKSKPQEGGVYQNDRQNQYPPTGETGGRGTTCTYRTAHEPSRPTTKTTFTRETVRLTTQQTAPPLKPLLTTKTVLGSA